MQVKMKESDQLGRWDKDVAYDAVKLRKSDKYDFSITVPASGGGVEVELFGEKMTPSDRVFFVYSDEVEEVL